VVIAGWEVSQPGRLHERQQSFVITRGHESSGMEQGKDHRPEAAIAAGSCVVDLCQPAIRGAHARPTLFNLAIDSKLRGCDLVALHVGDVAPNGYAIDRANIRQRRRVGLFGSSLTEHAAVLRRLFSDQRPEAGPVLVCRPRRPRSSSDHAPVCPASLSVGQQHQPRPVEVRRAQWRPRDRRENRCLKYLGRADVLCPALNR
jgi:hypothetical protein